MEPINQNALRGHLESLVLAVLEQEEGHGFEILRRIEEQSSGALHMKEGSLYPALYRLEQAGLLKAKWESGKTKRRGPRRRIYSLTKKGQKRLESDRQAWTHFVATLSPIIGTPA